VKCWLLIAVAAYALAAGYVIQDTGCTQTSHYALVRALASGSAAIDPWQEETCDKAWSGGRFYSVKAPAVAALVLPYYLVLRAADAVPGDPRNAIWVLGLLGAVLPGAALLALMRRVGERTAAGTGLPAAVAVGLGTLLLPFSTLLFGHVLSAALAFAAFAVLLTERDRGRSLPLLFAAGLLAGAAALAEYPAGLAALVLAGLVAAQHSRLARLAAYGAGLAVPLLGLLLYNKWAFGSFTHLSYVDTVLVPGDTGHDVVGAADQGLFGVTMPSPRVGLELLAAGRGLLVLTPLVGVAVAGFWLLFRAGRRAEALTAAGVCGAFFLYNSGIRTTFGGAFGGDSPGPRYLVVALPFLVLGVAAAARRMPATTAALAAVSVAAMVAGTVTRPMLEPDWGFGTWLDFIQRGEFTSTLLAWGGGVNGWPAAVLFLALVAVVAAAGLSSVRVAPIPRRALLTAGGALAAWALLAGTTPGMLADSRAQGDLLPLAAVAVFAAAAVLVVVQVERGARLSLAALAPLAVGYFAPGGPALVLAMGVVALAVAYAGIPFPRRPRVRLAAEFQRDVEPAGLALPHQDGGAPPAVP
jgi:hypothetical protein